MKSNTSPFLPVRLSSHAQEQCVERGATVAEVEETIRRGAWEQAKRDRHQARYNFPFDSEWNGRHYAIKQVMPVFVEEPAEIVVITVYTFYF